MVFDCEPACVACVVLGECKKDAAADDAESGGAFEFSCFECSTPQDSGGSCDADDCDGSVEMVTE